MREVPSIPAGLDPKLRNVLSAVRESLNAAITNINLYAENLAGLRQWIQPALDNNTDLITFNESFIQASLESATGADGAAGISARSVTLTAPDQAFTYNTNGANPSPASSVITANIFNTLGVVYYEFFVNDVSTGAATTNNTYTYTPQASFDSMPDKLEVQIREDSIDGPIEARDMMTMIGLRAGSNGITVMLSNEAHTLPRSTAEVVTYTGSGTKINVWEGATALTEDSSSPYANSSFRVTASGTGITPGAVTGTGTTTLTYGDASAMTTDPAKIIFTIIAKRQDGTEITVSKQQSLSFSQQGTAGAAGDSVDIVFVRSATQPATPTASPGTPTSPITWYSDVSSVPASANPLWSSVGFKTLVSANYTWSTPVKIEGTSVAEVTVFTRGVPTSTPTGGTYTFSTPPVLTVPTSTGATWSTSIPSGTTAVYTSRAVVSTAAGNTSAVAITGWTTPVISFQNGVRGSRQFYAYGTAWTDAAALAAVVAVDPAGVVYGDTVTISNNSNFVMVKYWNGSAWTAPGTVIDGSLIVTNSITAAKINSNGLSIKDAYGNIILAAGSALDFSNVGGSTKPANNATVGAYLGNSTGSGGNVTGKLGGVYIADLTVDTIHIKNNATAFAWSVLDSATIAKNSSATICSLAINPDVTLTSSMMIYACVTGNYYITAGTGTAEISVSAKLKNSSGSTIRNLCSTNQYVSGIVNTVSFSCSGYATGTILSMPAGSYTVDVLVSHLNGTTGQSVLVNATLFVQYIKK